MHLQTVPVNRNKLEAFRNNNLHQDSFLERFTNNNLQFDKRCANSLVLKIILMPHNLQNEEQKAL